MIQWSLKSVCLALAVAGSFLSLGPGLQGASAAPVRLLIVAGQSNAVGRNADGATLPVELDPQPDILFWYELGDDDTVSDPQGRISSGGWTDLGAQADGSSGTFTHATGFGPEIQLGRALADTSTDQIAILKFAINGTNLWSQWRASTGPLYVDLLALIQQALTALQSMGHQPTVAGFFWMQGEWDARNTARAMEYESNLTSFIAALRSDLGAPELPFVIGRLSIGLALEGDYPGLFTVRMAQVAVAADDPFTGRVLTDNLSLDPDNVHFDAAGQLGLGQLFAEAYASLAFNGEFILLDPDPGLAGQDNDFTVFGGPPGKRVYYVFGLQDGSTNIPDCPGVSLAIGDPVTPGRFPVSPLGVVNLSLRVPPGISGQTVRIQAFDRSNCRVSNRVDFAFP